MSSSRVVRVRPAEDGVRRRRCCATASPRSSASSRSVRSSRRRSRPPPRRRSRTRGCPTSTAPTCRWSPSTRPAPRTSTRRCTSRAPTTAATCCTTRSPTWRRSSRPGDPVDLEAHRRGQTLYGADSRVPLHPTVDLGGRRLAAARPGPPGAALDDHRWTARARGPTSRSSGPGCGRRAQLDYPGVQQPIDDGTADESLMLLKEVGELRLKREAARGGVSLPLPEQEVDTGGSGVGADLPRPAARSRSGTPRCRCSPASRRPR